MTQEAITRGTISVVLVEPDEELAADFDARDRRAFERQGRSAIGVPASTTLEAAVAGSPESYIVWIAWHALTRTGQTELTFKELEARTVKVHMDGDEAELLPDPTKPAP
jgi:hypothetical protein